jgi:hypothetical protein
LGRCWLYLNTPNKPLPWPFDLPGTIMITVAKVL